MWKGGLSARSSRGRPTELARAMDGRPTHGRSARRFSVAGKGLRRARAAKQSKHLERAYSDSAVGTCNPKGYTRTGLDAARPCSRSYTYTITIDQIPDVVLVAIT